MYLDQYIHQYLGESFERVDSIIYGPFYVIHHIFCRSSDDDGWNSTLFWVWNQIPSPS